MKHAILLSVLFAVVTTIQAQAMFAMPGLVPVDQLIKSGQTYLKKHPQEADAHYTLARIYYLAFSIKRQSIPGFPNDEQTGKPDTIPDFMRGWTEEVTKTKPEETNRSSLQAFAVEARHQFDEAIKLDSKNGLYVLGLANLLDEVRQRATKEDIKNLPPEFQNITLHDLRQLYAQALYLALPEDEKSQAMPPNGMLAMLVSYEAANALVRLAKEEDFTGKEKEDMTAAKNGISKLQRLPEGPITPIVFSFTPGKHLSQFLAPETVVDFDLRGYGFRDRWTWVRPELGFLVWDPKREGKITSARQLFGSYTFQIFRKTGYDALAALDDNGDGVLSDAEMKGISVWFDRNHNGVSDPGEVMPVEELGIRAIAVTATGRDGIHPTNARGIILTNGTVLRTWDWIAMPLPANETTRLALANSQP